MQEMQLYMVPDGTPEQARAVGLHYEIMAAAKNAAESLLDLGRKLKRMRDSGGYKSLGFASFGEYTEQAVGIRQRQAYTYIGVVENLPARLVEENAAAGVTKLALLAQLAPADREEVAGDLANITVKELKALIEEKNGLAEQLSMLAREPMEGKAEEVDLEAVRKEAEKNAWRSAEAKYREEMRAREEKIRAEYREEMHNQAEKAAGEQAAAMERKTEELLKTARRQAAEELKKVKEEAQQKIRRAKEEAANKAEKDIEEARRAAAEDARRQQEEKDRAALEKAHRDAETARAQAKETAKRLELAADEESIRFSLLFDALQDTVTAMLELDRTMREQGKAEKAEKYMQALRRGVETIQKRLTE